MCPGAFLLVKASLRGNAAEQGGELEGGEVPASNEMRIESLIRQGVIPRTCVRGHFCAFWGKKRKGFFLFFVPQT